MPYQIRKSLPAFTCVSSCWRVITVSNCAVVANPAPRSSRANTSSTRQASCAGITADVGSGRYVDEVQRVDRRADADSHSNAQNMLILRLLARELRVVPAVLAPDPDAAPQREPAHLDVRSAGHAVARRLMVEDAHHAVAL